MSSRYLIDDLHETIPVRVLDSLKAVDAERITTFVESVDAYTNYPVVALLPEDAVVLDDEKQCITNPD